MGLPASDLVCVLGQVLECFHVQTGQLEGFPNHDLLGRLAVARRALREKPDRLTGRVLVPKQEQASSTNDDRSRDR
jgi:hypothetical protein